MEKYIQDVRSPLEAVHHKAIRHDHQVLAVRSFLERKPAKSERNVEVDSSAPRRAACE